MEFREYCKVPSDTDKRAAYDELAQTRQQGKGKFQVPEGWEGELPFQTADPPGQPWGDIYASLVIVTPKVTIEKARQACETLQKSASFDPRSHLSGE